jgi:hypothetical protein
MSGTLEPPPDPGIVGSIEDSVRDSLPGAGIDDGEMLMRSLHSMFG